MTQRSFFDGLPSFIFGSQATISAVEKRIQSLGNPQSFVHDRGTAFTNTEFLNWTTEVEITLRSRTAHSLWTNVEFETQNQQIARNWGNNLKDAVNNWSSQAPNFAFVDNTSVSYTSGNTAYEIGFG